MLYFTNKDTCEMDRFNFEFGETVAGEPFVKVVRHWGKCDVYMLCKPISPVDILYRIESECGGTLILEWRKICYGFGELDEVEVFQILSKFIKPHLRADMKITREFTLEEALWWAGKWHKCQVDKSGNPYLLHVMAVASDPILKTDFQRIVAILHDVVEDTHVTFEMLLNIGVPEEIVEALKVLTHEKNEPYVDYINRIKMHPELIDVKIADIGNNSNPARIEKLPIEMQKRLKKKYESALEILKN